MQGLNELADVLGKKELTAPAPEETTATAPPELDKMKVEQWTSIDDIVGKYKDMFMVGEMEFIDTIKSITDEMSGLIKPTTEEFTR